MKTQYVEKNKGQILVIVTLMLVGLFAMLALVHEALEFPPQLKSIEACFVGEFNPQVGGWGGPVDSGAFVVSLKK